MGNDKKSTDNKTSLVHKPVSPPKKKGLSGFILK